MKKATSPATTSGNSVTLTANSLNEYTNYYYYVTVSDGKGNPVQGTVQGPIKTYCPGNTYTCDGPFYGTTRCYECEGCGTHTLANTTREVDNSCAGKLCIFFPNCKGAGAANCYRKGVCTKCGSTIRIYLCGRHESGINISKYACGRCDGTGRMSTSITCKHGYYSSHEYCIHNHTSQHDN